MPNRTRRYDYWWIRRRDKCNNCIRILLVPGRADRAGCHCRHTYTLQYPTDGLSYPQRTYAEREIGGIAGMVRRRRLLIFLMFVGIVMSACGGGETNPLRLSEQEMAGARLFTQHCAACHATSPDAIIVGPSLAGVAQRAETKVPGQSGRSYIETSILEPDAYVNEGFDDLMPKTFDKTLTSEEVDSLIAYLLTLE